MFRRSEVPTIYQGRLSHTPKGSEPNILSVSDWDSRAGDSWADSLAKQEYNLLHEEKSMLDANRARKIGVTVFGKPGFLSLFLALLTLRLLPAQSSDIPDYMYPVINDAGRMSIAAYGNDKELIDTLRQEGWGTPLQIDFPNGLHAAVWERNLPGGNTERIVAFVGTKDLAGVAADLAQGLVGPKATAQYRDGLDFALKQLAEKDRNPRLSVTFTGHSLGGGIAEQVNLETGVRAVVFNSAPLNGIDALLDKTRSGQAGVAATDLWNFRTKGDIVSALPLANQYGRRFAFDTVRPTTGQWAGDYSTHGVEALLDSINATRTTSASRTLSATGGFEFPRPATNPRTDFFGLANNFGSGRGPNRVINTGLVSELNKIDWTGAALGFGTSILKRGPTVANAAGQFEFLTLSSGRVVNVNRWGTWQGVEAGEFLDKYPVFALGVLATYVPVFAKNKVGSDAFVNDLNKAGLETTGAMFGGRIGMSFGIDFGPFSPVAVPLLGIGGAMLGKGAGAFVDRASASYLAPYAARAQIVDQWSWAVSRGQTSSTLSAWLGGRTAALNAGFSALELERYDALFRPQPNWGLSARTTSSLNFPRPHDADPGVSIPDHKDWAPTIVKRPPPASLPPPSPARPDPALLTTQDNSGPGSRGSAVLRVIPPPPAPALATASPRGANIPSQSLTPAASTFASTNFSGSVRNANSQPQVGGVLLAVTEQKASKSTDKANYGGMFVSTAKSQPSRQPDENLVATVFNNRSDDEEFEYDKRLGTSGAIETYLGEFPAGRHINEAQTLDESLAYEEASVADSIVAMETFLARFPSGNFTSHVAARLRELRFKRARQAADIELCKQFLIQYPQGKDSDELRRYLSSILK